MGTERRLERVTDDRRKTMISRERVRKEYVRWDVES